MASPDNVLWLGHFTSDARRAKALPHDQPAHLAPAPMEPDEGHFPDEYADLIAAMTEIGASFIPRTHQFHHPLHSGYSQPVVPWRRVISIPGITWLDEPENRLSWWARAMWLLDGRILICPGCGLDCT